MPDDTTTEPVTEAETEVPAQWRRKYKLDKYEKRRRKALIDHGNISISDLARAIGVGPRIVAALYAGKFRSRGPRSTHIEKRISDYLKLNDEWLWKPLEDNSEDTDDE